MRIAVISFTKRGAHLACRLAQNLEKSGHSCTAHAMPRHADTAGALPLTIGLAEWTAKAFENSDALIFVSACGVAVRAVAPLLHGKAVDPAVVVLDDCARFAVSLLSGHIGGANMLTQEVARATGAVPVVSTATDGNGVFAVDTWAVHDNYALGALTAAKAVSAALLDGKSVGFCSDFALETELPRGIEPRESGPLGICITLDEKKAPFETTLSIIPRALALGIGCKRGTTAETIAKSVTAALAAHYVSPQAVCAVASIDLKAEEIGLLEYCRQLGVPFAVYSAEQLAEVRGSFTPSEFVRGVTGIDNVCERAAVLGAGECSRLLIKKQAGNGVTVAAALCNWSVRF